jgi:phospholipid/cholesterol/gamma-HCH transport system substrate-binding protein
VVAEALDVTRRLSRVLSDDNIRSISELSANLGAASRTLPGTMREVDALVRDLRQMSGDLTEVAATLRTTAGETGPEITATIRRVRTVADNLASTTSRLDQAIKENSTDVRTFTRDGLPELERLLRDTRDAASEVQDLARSLRENPSRLLYQPPQSGMEIPR